MASLLSQHRGEGLTISRNGDRPLVTPRERLTDQHRAAIRENKSELLADLYAEIHPDLEAKRQELLRMLKARPDIKRAFIAEAGPNGGGRVSLALRDIGSCELVIPDGRFDPFAIMKLSRSFSQTAVRQTEV